jgi:sigma-E factor negative regulatory protein RseA
MVKGAEQELRQPSGEADSEWISVLMDGELDHREHMPSLARMKSSPVWREDWATYHLIGDTLRQTPSLSKGFDRRFAERLMAEPTALAPRRMVRRPLVALSAAASVAAIALAAWQSMQPSPDLGAGQMAEARNLAAASAAQHPRRNVSEYLIAHQEYSPSIAMQGVAPYVRTVYETQGEAGR